MIDKKVNKEALAAHNYYRIAHGCPKLAYNATLASGAQQWANELARTNQLKHSTGKDLGENLANRWCSAGVSLAGHEATEMWYDEIRLYNYNNQFSSATGHFTQVVWKGSKKAGFGRAITKDGKTAFIVGRYSPPGNVIGKFDVNVERPKKTVEKYEPKQKKAKRGCVLM